MNDIDIPDENMLELFCILLFIVGMGVGRLTCSGTREEIEQLEEEIDNIKMILWENNINPW